MLTRSEAQEIAAADRARKLSYCSEGYGPCDRSRGAGHVEARAVVFADRQRNSSACVDGKESCDYSLLTASEVIALKNREQRRNLKACQTGYGYCDLSRR